MGDLSVLSHVYEKSSEIAREINSSLIVLKKSLLYPEKMKSEDVRKAREKLVRLIQTIRFSLLQRERLEKWPDTSTDFLIPESLIENIREKKQSEMAYYLADLEDLQSRLQSEDAILQGDIALLDELSSFADAQASRFFRKIVRW